jgi:hypothetical protein
VPPAYDNDESDSPKGKPKEVFVGAPAWVVTFGDLMSLLLTFFVLLLSFSTMDPIRFKKVRGSLDQALGIQRKVVEDSKPEGSNILARTFNRRDFNQQVEAIIRRAVRDTFPPGSEFGRIEKFQDIRGETIRYVAYDLFKKGSDRPTARARLVTQAMGEALVEAKGTLEVRGVSNEALEIDTRERGVRRREGVPAVELAGRRAVIGAEQVSATVGRRAPAQSILPAVAGTLAPPKDSRDDQRDNLTEFVFFAADQARLPILEEL